MTTGASRDHRPPVPGWHRISKLLKSERGAVLVMAAFGFVAILALVGVSADVGKVLNERREMQNAADAAALAGAGVLLDGGTGSAARATAADWASRNGTAVTAFVTTPPTSGSHAGDANCVQVRVDETVAEFFTPLLSGKSVAANGTACITTQPKNYGVITLNPTVCNATYLNGNQTLTVDGGGTFTNSECATSAFYANGNASVTAEVNDAVGGAQISGGASVSPQPTRAKHINDPLAGLPVPAAPAGPVQVCPNFAPGETYILSPGVYNCVIDPQPNNTVTFTAGNYLIRDGINLNASANVVFEPGIYTLGGTGFKLNGNATVAANGAMFYMQNGTVIDMNGTGVATLRAPASGTYAGVLFFQSRSNATTVSINGNAVANGWGTIYAPAALVDFNGNGDTSFQIISDLFKMNGNANLHITFDNNITAMVRRIKLVQD